MSDKISVVLIDDHTLVRQGIRLFLNMQADIEVVGEASSGEQGIALVAEWTPDVVLIDLILPEGIDGVAATQAIRQTSPNTQIVILTSYDEDGYIFPALDAGALSYVLKSVTADKLAEIVRKAARGEAVVNPKVAARLLDEQKSSYLYDRIPYTVLTKRELQVLRLVATGMNNIEIADKLSITIKTVRAHVSNILRKLHLRDRTQATAYAWRKGIVRPSSG